MSSGALPTTSPETPCQKPSGPSPAPTPSLPLQSEFSADTSSGPADAPKEWEGKEHVSPKIVLGFHNTGSVDPDFSISVAKAIRYCGSFISHVFQWRGPYVTEARNRILQHLLDSGHQYLLMVDADEEFLPENVLKTWAVASMTGADIVWGNYCLGDFRNSIFIPPKEDQKDTLPSVAFELEPNMIYEDVYSGGTGWLFVTRDAVEKIKEAHKDDPWPFFNHDKIWANKPSAHSLVAADGHTIRMGEDISFGLRAHALGLKQVGYTGLVMTHIKAKKTAPAMMAPFISAHGLGQDILYGKAVPAEETEVTDEANRLDSEASAGSGEGEGSGDVEREAGDSNLPVEAPRSLHDERDQEVNARERKEMAGDDPPAEAEPEG